MGSFGEEVIFNDGMSFEERDNFWQIIYAKVSKAVKNRHLFSILFHLEEEGMDNEEGHSVIIQMNDYPTFLNNYLIWSEDLERYETCAEVKTLIKELEKWKEEKDIH